MSWMSRLVPTCIRKLFQGGVKESTAEEPVVVELTPGPRQLTAVEPVIKEPVVVRFTAVQVALLKFSGGGTVEELLERARALDPVQKEELRKRLFDLPRAWRILAESPMDSFGLEISRIRAAPDQKWVRSLTDVRLLLQLMKDSGWGNGFRQVFHERIIAIASEFPSGEALFLPEECSNLHRLVTGDGEVGCPDLGNGVSLEEGMYATQPDPEGWFQLPTPFYGGDSSAKWCSPEVYHALEVARSAERGSTLVTPWLMRTFYSHHPQHGYARFFWEISAGKGRSSHELPVEMFKTDHGDLMRRLDALHILAKAKLNKVEGLIPPDAWWVDCSIGTTARDRPKLVNAPSSRSMILMVGLYQVNDPRRLPRWWNLKTIVARPPTVEIVFKGEHGGLRSGDRQESLVVAMVEKGGTLVLAPTLGLCLGDGIKIRGLTRVCLTEEEHPALTEDPRPRP